MLPSIRRQTDEKPILLPAQYSAGLYCFRWLRNLSLLDLIIIAILIFPLTELANTQATMAQQSRGPQQRPAAPRPVVSQPQLQQMLQKKHNEAAVMILGGPPGTAYFNAAHDMAAALSTSNGGPRLIVVEAPGGIESLRDLLFLRGIDLALVPANILDYADAVGPGLRNRLTYVTALYGEEIHVLAGPGVATIQDLGGRKVAVPADDGNTEFTVRDLLRRLRIEAEIVKAAAADAIDDVRSGTFAALVLVGGKPLRFAAALPKDGALRLLPVPSRETLGEAFSPGSFTASDYPTLIPGEQTIDTVSVAVVLVANKTPAADESSQRIARFVPAFFGSMSDLAGPRWHPKWGEVNLAATLDKWSRVPTAKEWLDNALREQSASVQKDFDEFLRVNGLPGAPSPAVRKQLFEQYLKWTRSTTAAPR
jgi:TRAP-type uncharacterized transport system substrate-binding protein